MDFFKENWIVVLVVLIGAFFLLSRKGSPGSVVTVPGDDAAAITGILSAERNADEQSRLAALNLFGGLWSGQMESAERDLDRKAQIEIARIQGQTATAANNAQIQIANAQYQQQLALANLQYRAAKKQKNSQDLQTILGTILGGLGMFIQPQQQGGGWGGFSIPQLPGGWVQPTFGGGWRF